MFTLKVDSDVELQIFQQHHGEELFWMVNTNRDHLRKWLPWVDGMQSAVQYHSIIQMWLKQLSENNSYNLGIRYQGSLAGTISLHGMDWRNSQASIGYYLAENMQGKGIMIRAAKAIIDHAFFELGLNRIEIRCGRMNVKSQAIPKKLGFIHEGIIQDGEFINGGFHDLFVYGMLSRQWGKRN